MAEGRGCKVREWRNRVKNCLWTETQHKFSRDPELWNLVYWKACPSLKRFSFSLRILGRVFVVLCLGCLFLSSCAESYFSGMDFERRLRGVSHARL